MDKRAARVLVLLLTVGGLSLAMQNGSAGTVHFVLDVNGYFQ